jgi:hypothetical protein
LIGGSVGLLSLGLSSQGKSQGRVCRWEFVARYEVAVESMSLR